MGKSMGALLRWQWLGFVVDYAANNNHNNSYNNSNDSSKTSGVRAFSPARTSPVCTHGVLDYRNCGVSPFQPISFYMTLDREDNLLLLCLRHACLPRQAPNHSKNIPNSSTRSSHTPIHFFFCCWTKWITKSILCPLGRSHLILFLLQTLDQCVFFKNLTVKEGYFLSYLMHNSTLSMTPTMRWHSYTCLICHTWVTRESQMVISECESTPTVANYTREVARPHFHF